MGKALKTTLTAKDRREGLGCRVLRKEDCDVLGGGRVLTPYGRHTHTLVFLHQLDGKALDFVRCCWWFHGVKGLRIVLPDAPLRDSKLYGERLTCWYDYHEDETTDRATLAESTERVVSILQAEIATIGADKVLFGGYSQGAVMAFHCLMDPRLPPLHSFVSISGAVHSSTDHHLAQAATRIRFHVPDMDDIYEPRGTTQRLDSLIAAGFTDLKYEVHKKRKHGSQMQRKWVQDFLAEMLPV